MKISKIEEFKAKNEMLEQRVTFLEQALKVTNEALVKLNGQTTEIATELTKMQNEEIWGGKIENE